MACSVNTHFAECATAVARPVLMKSLLVISVSIMALLPGFCQARATMNMAIELLEYFAREAEHELTTGIRQDHGPVNREMASHIRIMRALMNSFARLHQPPD